MKYIGKNLYERDLFMTIMTNMAEEVKKFLDNSPCIRRNMDIKLINNRALAKMIIKEKKLNTTLDSVTSAIRRYRLDSHNPIFDTAHEILCHTNSLSTKDRMVSLSIINETEIQTLLPKLYSTLEYNQENVLRIIQLNKFLKIIMDEKNLDKIKMVFTGEKINKIHRNIAEIKLNTHPKAHNTPGIIALIATELAMNDINVIDIMSSNEEIVLYVEEKDLVKTHNVIHNLCQVF